MATMAAHCSQRERRAEEAERDVLERMKCAWLEKHVGEAFAGRVTGVTSFGLFVDLDGHGVSGLVHVSQLSNDYYHFDAERRLLKGERSGHVYRLGDEVRVQVLRASMEDRKIDFRLLQGDADGDVPQGGRKHGGKGRGASKSSAPKDKSRANAGTGKHKKRSAGSRETGKRGSRKK
jgi:ribonuclease R